MKSFVLVSAFRVGVLLQLTVSVVVLAVAVIVGPALAWRAGMDAGSLLIATVGVIGHAAAGFINAASLWPRQVSPALIMRTVGLAVVLGHGLFFGALGFIGIGTASLPAGVGGSIVAVILDSAIVLVAAIAGALIAAAPPRRRRSESRRYALWVRVIGPRNETPSL